jgi:hypothetical protein
VSLKLLLSLNAAFTGSIFLVLKKLRKLAVVNPSNRRLLKSGAW